MRQVLCIAWLCLAGLAPTAQVANAQTTDPLYTFATCAGRLSAQMEFEWMFDGPGSERTEAQRATMIGLMSSVMPADMGREVLSWRIGAKAAHSALLTRAAFSDEPEDAVWATRRAEALVSECTSMLLS